MADRPAADPPRGAAQSRGERLRPAALSPQKRVLDALVSGVALLLLALPMAAIALAILATAGPPVLFRQTRPGLGGRPFVMIKFRTMTDARDEIGTIRSDRERLTRLGGWLRRTSLDELPELWNVARGQMSLVGPRPLLTRYTPYFATDELIRFTVRPGITGWAQVNGRNATGWDARLAMDSWYVRNCSLGLDVRILFRTCSRVLRGSGVLIDPSSTMLDLDVERRGDREES